jgi:uncharacterized membrane protein (UPF0127 family)
MEFKAQLPETLEKGLGGQTSIEKPMLFEFPDYRVRRMWMQGMLVPIDIVWFDDGGTVTKIYENVPTTVGPKYSSITPAKYAIECAAGDARRLGLVVGAHIRILRNEPNVN